MIKTPLQFGTIENTITEMHRQGFKLSWVRSAEQFVATLEKEGARWISEGENELDAIVQAYRQYENRQIAPATTETPQVPVTTPEEPRA